jgi:hypothetical protein
METYKQIKEFTNYEVSNLGNVRNIKTGRVLKLKLSKNGYYQLNLYKDYKSYPAKVHRLVAITYINNPHMLPEVDHKDRNKQNNSATNLRWSTRTSNIENRMFNVPFITYHNKCFLVYEPKLKTFHSYDNIIDANNMFLSLI